MGLQKHAQEDVEQKIEELYIAFTAGHNLGGEYWNHPSWRGFTDWLREAHPLLHEYCTPQLGARLRT